MSRHSPVRIGLLAALLAALASLSACHVVGGGVRVQAGAAYPPPPAHRPPPPPHAPAHGRRRAEVYHYYYYPEVSIYFDTRRGMYFYLSGGRWISSVTLPHHLRGRLSGRVELELGTPEPWREYHRHRKAYPPGYFKKRKKRKKHHRREHED